MSAWFLVPGTGQWGGEYVRLFTATAAASWTGITWNRPSILTGHTIADWRYFTSDIGRAAEITGYVDVPDAPIAFPSNGAPGDIPAGDYWILIVFDDITGLETWDVVADYGTFTDAGSSVVTPLTALTEIPLEPIFAAAGQSDHGGAVIRHQRRTAAAVGGADQGGTAVSTLIPPFELDSDDEPWD